MASNNDINDNDMIMKIMISVCNNNKLLIMCNVKMNINDNIIMKWK